MGCQLGYLTPRRYRGHRGLGVDASTCFVEGRMHRAITLVGLALLLTIPAIRANSQAKPSKAQKIANAMTAAPRSLSSKATIMDWPASEGAQMTTLRTGSNGWTCLPDFPPPKETTRCVWTISGCRS